MRWEEADTWRPLWGISEIAQALGERRQTVAMWRARGQLPEPDVELAMGPVWFGGEVSSALETGEIESWIALRIENQMQVPSTESEQGEKWARGAAESAQRLQNGPLVQAFAASAFRAAAEGCSYETWSLRFLASNPDMSEMLDTASDDIYGQGLWPWAPFLVDPTTP